MVHRFSVGAFSCAAICDVRGRYPREMFLTNLEPGVFEGGEIELPYHCLLIETGRERILIDSGTGFEPHPGPPGRLLELLRGEGIAAGEISTVILSHLHSDHAGGCLDAAGRPAFPNARCVVSRPELDFWSGAAEMREMTASDGFKEEMRVSARRILAGLEGVLEVVEADQEIAPGIVVAPAFGHSPGHLVVELRPAGAEFLFLADALVDVLHVEYPETIGETDHLPVQTVETRRRWLEAAARRGCLVGTSHLPGAGLGRVVRRGSGWGWVRESG